MPADLRYGRPSVYRTYPGFIEEIEDIVIPEVYNLVDYLARVAWKYTEAYRN